MASDDDKDPYEVISDRTSAWANRRAQGLAKSRHPVLKVVGVLTIVVAVCIGLGIVSGFIGLGSSILSPTNIKTQRTAVINDWQALLTATGNACQAVQSASGPGSPTLIESPGLAYAATVRNIRSDYNDHQHNLFESERNGPPGYPRTVPDQVKMDAPKPDWCQITQDLEKVHD